MIIAPVPQNETERLAELRRLAILDSIAEESFDDLTRLASEICEAPISLISLVDSERQWFKSKVGLAATQTTRDVSFCGHAIMGDELFEVQDSLADERFHDNPLTTGAPHVRFYAGFPLITQAQLKIGTLCVIDHRPKKLSAWQIRSLRSLARQAVILIEARFREEELTKAKNSLEFILEGSGLGAWDWNIVTNELRFDRRWCEMLGINFENASPDFATWETLVHPEDLPRVAANLKRHIESETGFYESTYRMKHVSGQWLWIAGRAKISERSSDGRPTRMSGTNYDITTQKKNEQILRDNQEKVEAIYQGSHDAIMMLSANGFFDCNKKTLEMFGVSSREDFIKHQPADLSPLFQPDGTLSSAKAQAYISAAFENGFSNFEWMHAKVSGEVFPAEVLLSAFELQGEKVLQATVRDISERKKLEARFDEQQRIVQHQTKLASIGELAAGVGHEINNPLAIIKGYLAYLEEDLRLGGYQNEQSSSMFMKINAASDRIVTIVKNLRIFSRSDSTQLVVFELKDAVLETVNLLEGIYQREGVRLAVHLEASQQLPVYGNKGRIEQVIVNLLSNAKDATEGRDSRTIEVTLQQVNGRARLAVTDNGAGIPEHIRDRIFDPFFTTKETNKGTGIGLSILSSIIKEHEGQVSFTSSEGAGTTFIVEIPLATMRDASPLVPPEQTPAGKLSLDLQVLVVDDEEDIRDLLATMLARIGITATTADSGKSALQEFSRGGFDLVITDLRMPQMNGLELIKAIRRQQSVKVPKIILVSGGIDVSQTEDEELSSLADVQASKPMDRKLLVQQITELFPEKDWQTTKK